MNLKNRNFLKLLDFTPAEIDELIAVANDIIANPDDYCEKCKRKIRRHYRYAEASVKKSSADACC